jgi:hypothetical protein
VDEVKVETVKKKPVTVAAARLSREEMLAMAGDLGTSREVMAGALHGARGETFTVDQAKNLVDKFLRRRVR